MHGIYAGILEELFPQKSYRFTYDKAYNGPPISLTTPFRPEPYEYDSFPPFLEGLLPEGYNLEALLRVIKADRKDLFSQIIAVGMDMVGALTVQEAE